MKCQQIAVRAWTKASAVRRGGVETRNQTLYTTVHPEGGVEAGYQKDVVGVSTLVNSFGTLFECNICDDRRGGPNVDLPIACVLRYPKSGRILLAADDPMTLAEPLFGDQYCAVAQDGSYP
jgi:hypothetical protein